MTRGVLRSGAALFSGLLFGVGLVVSGMTRPAKVLAFLDVLGPWDPSLAFVMLGAIGVHAAALRIIRRRAPLAAPAFSRPPSARIDVPLVLGAVTFGVGWGLSGYCPGPSLVSLPAGGAPGLVFVLSFVAGNLLISALKSPLFARAAAPALRS